MLGTLYLSTMAFCVAFCCYLVSIDHSMKKDNLGILFVKPCPTSKYQICYCRAHSNNAFESITPWKVGPSRTQHLAELIISATETYSMWHNPSGRPRSNIVIIFSFLAPRTVTSNQYAQLTSLINRAVILRFWGLEDLLKMHIPPQRSHWVRLGRVRRLNFNKHSQVISRYVVRGYTWRNDG